MTTYLSCLHTAPLSCPDCDGTTAGMVDDTADLREPCLATGCSRGAEPGSPYCTADSLLDAEALAHLVSA